MLKSSHVCYISCHVCYMPCHVCCIHDYKFTLTWCMARKTFRIEWILLVHIIHIYMVYVFRLTTKKIFVQKRRGESLFNFLIFDLMYAQTWLHNTHTWLFVQQTSLHQIICLYILGSSSSLMHLHLPHHYNPIQNAVLAHFIFHQPVLSSLPLSLRSRSLSANFRLCFPLLFQCDVCWKENFLLPPTCRHALKTFITNFTKKLISILFWHTKLKIKRMAPSQVFYQKKYSYY